MCGVVHVNESLTLFTVSKHIAPMSFKTIKITVIFQYSPLMSNLIVVEVELKFVRRQSSSKSHCDHDASCQTRSSDVVDF